METTLRFELRPKSHPFPEDARHHRDAWGCLDIHVLMGGERIQLLRWEWDLALLAEWYIKNRQALRGEELCIEGNGPLAMECLADAEARLRDREFAEDEGEAFDRWYDALYEYYERHALRIALPGARIPDITIGCNRGRGNISLLSSEDEESGYNDNPPPGNGFVLLGEWSYRFDMEDFCSHLHQELREFLGAWAVPGHHADIAKRARDLLQRLEQDV